MSTFNPLPSGINRIRTSQPPSIGVTESLNPVNLTVAPADTSGQRLAAGILDVFGQAAGVADAVIGAQVSSEQNRIQVEQNRLAELDKRAKAEDRLKAISDNSTRGQAIMDANELGPSIMAQITSGKLTVPEGQDIRSFVLSLIEKASEGQTDVYKEQFRKTAAPALIAAFEKQRAGLVAQAQADTIETQANFVSQNPGASEKVLSTLVSGGFTSQQAILALVSGAKIAAKDGRPKDVAQIINTIPEEFRPQYTYIIDNAAAKKQQNDNAVSNDIYESVTGFIGNGLFDLARNTANNMAERGLISQATKVRLLKMIDSEIAQQHKVAEAENAKAEHDNQLSLATQATLASINDPSITPGILEDELISAGLTKTEITKITNDAFTFVFDQVNKDVADGKLTQEQGFARQVNIAAQNSYTPKIWQTTINAAGSAIGSNLGESSVPIIDRAYALWSQLNRVNPHYAADITNTQTQEFLTLIDAYKTFVSPNDTLSGQNGISDAVFAATQAVQNKGNYVVGMESIRKNATDVDTDAYGSLDVMASIRQLTKINLAMNAPNDEAAIEAAQKSVLSKYSKFGGAYYLSNDVRMPKNIVSIGGVLLDSFAEKLFGHKGSFIAGSAADTVGVLPGLKRKDIAFIFHDGIFEIMDISSGVPKPLPRDGPGGSKLNVEAIAFTQNEIIAMALDQNKVPDPYKAAVAKWRSKQPDGNSPIDVNTIGPLTGIGSR